MHTINIPGGTAVFYDQGEIKPRRLRPMQEATMRLGNLLDRVVRAQAVGTQDPQPAFPAPGMPELNATQACLVAGLQDQATWAYLASWSLPETLPATADGLLDLDMPLYQALSAEGARIFAATTDRYTIGPDTAADLTSPTGASDVSGVPSEATTPPNSTP